jgi:transcriptional regulator with XRE-family HTH domain
MKLKGGVCMDNKNIFARNLQWYMEANGKSRKDVSEAIGVSYYTFTDWVKGKKYPRMDKVEKLAAYFGILKSDLIEEKTEEHREMQKKNDTLSDIVIRMQTDDVFRSAVESLYKQDQKKLLSILTLLD